MAIERYANSAATTLNGSINNSVTSLVVTSATGFPSDGNFRLLIGTEILIVTAVSGTTYTVTRGAEGTTAASHTNGDVITHILTRDALYKLRQDLISYGADASRPTQEAVGQGRIYLDSDDCILSHDDGSTWQTFGPIHRFVPPVDSQFSWLNQGGATTVQKNGSILLTVGVSATSNIRGRVKTIPAAPYDIRMAYIDYGAAQSAYHAGMILRNSSSSKIIMHGSSYYSGGFQNNILKWTNETTFSAFYGLQNGANIMQHDGGILRWVRIQDDNTNRNCYISPDGLVWNLIQQSLRTDFFTPDQIGFAFDQENTTFSGAMRIVHWEQ